MDHAFLLLEARMKYAASVRDQPRPKIEDTVRKHLGEFFGLAGVDLVPNHREHTLDARYWIITRIEPGRTALSDRPPYLKIRQESVYKSKGT